MTLIVGSNLRRSIAQDQGIVGTSGSGVEPELHSAYFQQLQPMMSIFSFPQAIHSGLLFLNLIFLNSHLRPSQVSSCPARLLAPAVNTFTASTPSTMATSPGTIPTTPRVEHPPALTCSSPQMHLQHGASPPQHVTWPYHPTHAPLSSRLLRDIRQSLTRYRHCGLSEPSITRSYWSSRCRVCLVMNGCQLTVTVGLNLRMLSRRDLLLAIPVDELIWPICRCKLLISTTSESNSPRVPTPAPARYRPKGQPMPPAPINATLLVLIFSCPSQRIYFSSICLAYRESASPYSGGVRLVSSGP